MTHEIDIQAFENELGPHCPTDIRVALLGLDDHPLRGSDKSSAGVTENGKVQNGDPKAGVSVRYFGGQYHFTLTEVGGDVYVKDTFSMSPASFKGFVAALRDVLGKR